MNIKQKVGAAISTAMYSSNQLNSGKSLGYQNETMPSARNTTTNNQGLFVSGIANGVLNSGNADQAPMREVNMNELQRSSEMGGKIDR